ncbi:MAG: hypothetical protein IT270_07145, partial [Saprospiraceae bacterium]|nr:hypothetical protein [Saprospiraceae bacterium]
AGSRQQAAGSRQQAAGSRQQAAGSRQQAAGSRQQAAKKINLNNNIKKLFWCDFLINKAAAPR